LIQQWDGKTIALGTFSAMEAVEKCERAKSLTKKWRATMVPKPDVEWVKKALERLNIRVVNDRPGRRRKDEVLEKERKKNASGLLGPHMIGGDEQMYGLPSMGRQDKSDSSMFFSPQQGFHPGGTSTGNENSMSSMNAYGMSGMTGNTGNARMSSGNMAGNSISRRFSNDEPGMAQFNPMQMGNNATSNFESSMARNPYQQGLLSRDFGMNAAGKIPGLDSPGNSRQHYGVLKEHHDNLLKELQQTTYMMQMYQRNYEQADETVSNFMNGSMYGSNSMAGGAMGPRRDSFTFGQGQGRQNQGFNNSIQYPYDRRNSLGFADASLPRNSMQNSYLSSAAGNAGLQMQQNQHSNMMLSDLDRVPNSSHPGSLPNSSRSPNNRRQSAAAEGNDVKRPKIDQAGATGSNLGYSSSKQEEV